MIDTQRQIVLLAMILCSGIVLISDAFAQKTIHNSQTNIDTNNEMILSASSPFEDLTEFAISGDKKRIERALKSYDTQAIKVESVLPAKKRDELRALVASIRKATQQGDYRAIALKSPEAYRLLIEALNRGSLKVPIEVSLLDYAGFKFKALLYAKPGDWKALQEVGKQAQKNWDTIKPKVTDKGLNRACVSKNADMALFAAQVDLALVDLLEAEFEKIAK
jgi:hypothetical protein